MADDIVVYKTVLTGLDPDGVALVAATGAGDLCPNDGKTFLFFENGASQEVVVTINSIRACNHGQDHNSITTIPVNKRRMIGPFDRGRFNNAAGKLEISYGGAVLAFVVKAVSVTPTLV